MSLPRRRFMQLAAAPLLLANPLGRGSLLAAEGRGDFAVRLLGAVATDWAANALVSPSSATGLLLMLAVGASLGGKQAILTALDGTPPEEPNSVLVELIKRLPASDPALVVARSIWIDHVSDVLESYQDQLTARLGAELRTAAFGALDTLAAVNGWVSDRTNGLVPRLLDRIDAGTAMIALDALYFKAHWAIPFDANHTEPGPFRRVGGDTVELPMMRLPEVRLAYRSDEALEAVLLSYLGERFAAVLIRPHDEAADAIELLERRGPDGEGWLQGLGFATRTIDLVLPRLTLEGSIDLIASLRELGINLGNDPGSLTFPGISEPEAKIGMMVQQVVLRIDEGGTEAAAASAAAVTRELKPAGDKLSIRFDRPFVLAVTDLQSSQVVVAAAVRSPASSS